MEVKWDKTEYQVLLLSEPYSIFQMIISIELYKCKENVNSMSCVILVVLLNKKQKKSQNTIKITVKWDDQQLDTQLQYKLKSMNDEDLTKILNRYFKQPAVDQKDVVKIMAYIQDFAARHKQIHLVQKVFRIAEDAMRKQNLKVIIKRYLHVINEMLEKDQQVQPAFRYQQAVSAEIVPQFLTMLRNLLNYGPMDLLPDMKFYRKRWAKRISDQAYTFLQNQSQRQLRVDLERGFSEEYLKKLTKIYQKRQFSKSDLEKYLPTNNLQNGQENRKNSAAVSSSSSEGEGHPRKRVKKQSEERVADRRNDYNSNSDMDMSRHSFIPSNSNSFGNGFASDPRRPNQIMYPVHPQNIYSPSPYPNINRVTNSGVGQRSFYPVQPQGFYQQQPSTFNSYPYQGQTNPVYNYPTSYQNYQNTGYDSYGDRKNDGTQYISTKLGKFMSKVEYLKRSWYYECKFCGILISTTMKYDEHMLQHFQQSQKSYQNSHSRTDHTKKPNKGLLPTHQVLDLYTQQWMQSKRIKLTDKKFQVRIELDKNMKGNETCTICSGQLKVSWSDEIDTWVYQDAIKAKVKGRSESICHSECYHTIQEFQRSSDDSRV